MVNIILPSPAKQQFTVNIPSQKTVDELAPNVDEITSKVNELSSRVDKLLVRVRLALVSLKSVEVPRMSLKSIQECYIGQVVCILLLQLFFYTYKLHSFDELAKCITDGIMCKCSINETRVSVHRNCWTYGFNPDAYVKIAHLDQTFVMKKAINFSAHQMINKAIGYSLHSELIETDAAIVHLLVILWLVFLKLSYSVKSETKITYFTFLHRTLLIYLCFLLNLLMNGNFSISNNDLPFQRSDLSPNLILSTIEVVQTSSLEANSLIKMDDVFLGSSFGFISIWQSVIYLLLCARLITACLEYLIVEIARLYSSLSSEKAASTLQTVDRVVNHI